MNAFNHSANSCKLVSALMLLLMTCCMITLQALAVLGDDTSKPVAGDTSEHAIVAEKEDVQPQQVCIM
jgi:hypothetical protein